MPWNQPGSGGNDNDPWGQKGGGRSGPPDLDEIVKNFQKNLGGLFGGRKSGGGKGNGSSSPSAPGGLSVFVIVLAVLGALGYLSLYTVDEGTRAVVLRFGQYHETTTPGLHWRIPGIDDVVSVNVQKVNTVEVGYRQAGERQQQPVPREALMLTRDENIVDIKLAVQYNVKDPEDLVFNVAEYPFNPETVVRGATESALREVVGANGMDFTLTEGRSQIAGRSRELLQQILDRYEAGINIIDVEMQDAQPPREVKPAFDDAVKAREDEVRFKNEAEAYANDIIPRARGRAAREIQEAEAYKASVIARAQGEASRFEQILNEYSKAPDITRKRLYLEKMEQVMTNSSKLMIDQSGGNNVIYLPLDQLMRQRNTQNDRSDASTVSGFVDDQATANTSDSRSRLNLRQRGN